MEKSKDLTVHMDLEKHQIIPKVSQEMVNVPSVVGSGLLLAVLTLSIAFEHFLTCVLHL